MRQVLQSVTILLQSATVHTHICVPKAGFLRKESRFPEPLDSSLVKPPYTLEPGIQFLFNQVLNMRIL